MRFGAAIAMGVLLSLPAWAQHQGGGSGGGSAGHGGGGHAVGAVHAGGSAGRGGGQGGYSGRASAPSYSGLVGMQAPSSFSQPGRFPMPGRLQAPPRAGMPLPYRGNGFMGGYAHGPDYRGRYTRRGPYRGHDRDRRYRGYASYGYAPGYVYPYPYVVDPGFYDWGATDYSENQQGPYTGAPTDPGPDSGYGPEQPGSAPGDAPYPQQQEYAQPLPAALAVAQRQEYHFATASPSSPSPITSRPLTVIFKGGRASEKMQNYMVTSTALTNLDGEHFEKIPLDQIDVAATQQANRSSGIDFQVPVASRD